jgi:glycosyltransferase involved in cell wall biosynthesis
MKVSIITISLNSANTIRETIESVLCQTYANIEYIIIDGKSTDGTMDIVRSYEPIFEGRLKYISEPDKGLYDALNKGLLMTTGNIIGCLHSDDYFSSPDILSIVAVTFEKHSVDAIYGDIHFVSKSNSNKVLRKYSSRLFSRSLMRLGFMPAHPSFYFKRTCIEKYGLYNTSYKIGGDFELLLRYIFIYQIKTIYLPVNFVTMRTGGISTGGLSSHKIIMTEHLRAFRENGVYTNRFLLSLRYLYKLTEFRF